jgi:NAD(P)-dependent dehydrogenase (short-subunit alcohol dehydrogenase family)
METAVMTADTESVGDRSAEARGVGPQHERMAGRRVLVVGAGQGDYGIQDQPIGNGRAIAALLAREGAIVTAADVVPAAAESTVDLIRSEGGQAYAVRADVAEPEQVEHMVTQANELMGGMDGLVYNVGISGPQGISNATPEAWDRTIDVNLRGPMLTTQKALPVLARGSAIVFISSVASLIPAGKLVAYEASKSGMTALMRAVAYEGLASAIRCNIVMPGGIDTGLARAHSSSAGPAPGNTVPLGRRGTAWDTAYATLFLLSGESTFVTGQSLAVDGGLTTLKIIP